MGKKVKVVNFKYDGFGPLIFRTKDSQFHFYQYYSIMQDMGDEHHHLYYVEREYGLKKGQWAIQFNDIGTKPVEVFVWNHDTPPAPEAVIFKIIASTNDEISNCPQISNWQINQFCIKEYDEVELKTKTNYIEPPATMHSNRGHFEEVLSLDDDAQVQMVDSIETFMSEKKEATEKELEQIFDESAKENMDNWSLNSFKKSHAKLFKSIMSALKKV
jgi:hypothetical protein